MLLTTCRSFAPLAESSAKVLILGSMPGAESLRQQQYYAFGRNAFWRIMGSVCNFDPALPYEERCVKVTAAGIALWDVLGYCERKGSSDAAIRHPEPNDVPGLLRKLPQVKTILCNGTASYDNLRRFFPQLKQMTLHLPSTSPAAALYSPQQKLDAWRAALAPLLR